jgi:hypothetical protein
MFTGGSILHNMPDGKAEEKPTLWIIGTHTGLIVSGLGVAKLSSMVTGGHPKMQSYLGEHF